VENRASRLFLTQKLTKPYLLARHLR
jgi:hypothetical protein